MKKIIAVALAAFALNATAYTGNGNERIDMVRDYLRVTEAGSGTTSELQNWSWFVGVVTGLASAFDELGYSNAICYPKESKSLQISEIAAKYIVDHPEERTESINLLTWRAHREAFGLKREESCYEHDEWLKWNS